MNDKVRTTIQVGPREVAAFAVIYGLALYGAKQLGQKSGWIFLPLAKHLHNVK